MAKLTAENKFFDCSDYGRLPARWLVQKIKHSHITSIHLTLLFGIAGLCGIGSILMRYNIAAGFFLILKSILDAADGELARVKNKPSYTGRYLDSIFDIILNFLILMAICFVTDTHFILGIIAFFMMQWQGTLYNYYYVILRTTSSGADVTSKVFEHQSPLAFAGETQKSVDIMFKIFYFLYAFFDKSIYYLDKKASKIKTFPNWFMTLVSLYGLGFQLLLIAIMLWLGWNEYIILFFIFYIILMPFIVGIRKVGLKFDVEDTGFH
jgi:phosphatidylserine synthase